MRSIAIYAIVFLTNLVFAQANLIVNPGAELPPNTANGWTPVFGNWVQQNNSSGGIVAHGGSNHFGVPGSCGIENSNNRDSELQQTIDVSSYASEIDASTAEFTFTGWVATYPTSKDYSRMLIEYLDVSNNVLYTFDTGKLMFTSWTKRSDIHIAPVGTRKIRIRLISRCSATGSDDDGYYDDLSLTVRVVTTTPVNLLYFEAKNLYQSILLTWATATEFNNKEFNLYKSADGETWTKINTQTGQGTSLITSSYQYSDLTPGTGVQYYKLTQTDLDETTRVAKIISIYRNGDEVILLNSEGIIIPNFELKQCLYYDMAGKLIYQIDSNNKEEPLLIPIRFMIRGIGILKIITNDEIITMKINVQ